MNVRTVAPALLLILTGAFLGIAIERAVHHHGGIPEHPNAVIHSALMTQLDSAIDLDNAQRDSLEAIFRRHQTSVDSAWISVNSHMHATMDSVRIEIEHALRPNQLPAFRTWMQRHHGAPGSGH